MNRGCVRYRCPWPDGTLEGRQVPRNLWVLGRFISRVPGKWHWFSIGRASDIAVLITRPKAPWQTTSVYPWQVFNNPMTPCIPQR